MPATRDGKLWRSQFYYKDWQGVRRKKNKRGFKTKGEADEWERNFLQQQQKNLDISFDIETVSDVLSLLFKLDEQVDMKFEAERDENGEFIPSTVKFSFQNAAINNKLCTYLKAKQIKENLENSKNKLSAEDNYAETITEIEQNIEDIKNHLVDDNMVVKKGTNRITVKVFPQ